jgi:glycosyltransferase involved in cell wall biosynthesis
MGEIVEEGRSGFLVSPQDSKALAERLIQLLEDSALARGMGTRAQVRVRSKFLWQHVIDRVETALLTIPLSG